MVDAHDPENPVEVGWYLPGAGHEAWSVAVEWPHVLVGRMDNGSPGLDVVDVTSPSAPVLVGTCPLAGLPRRLAAADGLVFVAADTNGMRVVDLSSPADPVEVGSWAAPSTAYSVAVVGVHVYVANLVAAGGASNGLYVVDVSDPAVPVDAGLQLTAGRATDVAAWGGLVHLADGGGGLVVFAECGGAIFADGFESGGTELWTVVAEAPS